MSRDIEDAEYLETDSSMTFYVSYKGGGDASWTIFGVDSDMYLKLKSHICGKK